MADRAPDAHLPAYERYRAAPQQAHARWGLLRVLLGGLTGVACARAWEVGAGGRWWVGALWGTFVLYGVLTTMATVWARAEATRVAPFLLRAIRAIDLVMGPVLVPLGSLAARLAAWAAGEPSAEDGHHQARRVESEVGHLLTDASQTGEFGAEPAELIRNVLEFKDLTVREVMVPRIKVVAIEASTPVDEAMRLVAAEGHSRYPVYRGKTDNIVGVLYAKDLFQFLRRADGGLMPPSILSLARAPVIFVPETQLVSDVLREMRQRRQHMALAIDEFGGFAGVLTLEDILEEIVGDIHDEHDDDDAQVEDLGDGRWLVDASVKLSDFGELCGRDLGDLADDEGEYDSLGGLLVHEAGRVPSAGERIVVAGFEFLVREADAKRVTRVEVLVPPPSSRGRATAHPPPSPAPA
jgi:CBS domain containing-hemolysin-like protein